MLYALDVDYRPDGAALAAAVGFARWTDAAPAEERTALVASVEPYEPGAFYKRELPCLRAVLAAVAGPVDLVVVDAHVWLKALDQPGLGGRLWESLGRAVPVVGVAKQPFIDGVALPLTRGASAKPLWISAAGTDPVEARERVREMHGEHRLPTILKRVDALCRGR